MLATPFFLHFIFGILSKFIWHNFCQTSCGATASPLADLQHSDALCGAHRYHLDRHDAGHPAHCAELLSTPHQLPDSSNWWLQLVLEDSHVLEVDLCVASAPCTSTALDLVLLPSHLRDCGPLALSQPPSSLSPLEECETPAQGCDWADLWATSGICLPGWSVHSAGLEGWVASFHADLSTRGKLHQCPHPCTQHPGLVLCAAQALDPRSSGPSSWHWRCRQQATQGSLVDWIQQVHTPQQSRCLQHSQGLRKVWWPWRPRSKTLGPRHFRKAVETSSIWRDHGEPCSARHASTRVRGFASHRPFRCSCPESLGLRYFDGGGRWYWSHSLRFNPEIRTAAGQAARDHHEHSQTFSMEERHGHWRFAGWPWTPGRGSRGSSKEDPWCRTWCRKHCNMLERFEFRRVSTFAVMFPVTVLIVLSVWLSPKNRVKGVGTSPTNQNCSWNMSHESWHLFFLHVCMCSFFGFDISWASWAHGVSGSTSIGSAVARKSSTGSVTFCLMQQRVQQRGSLTSLCSWLVRSSFPRPDSD